MINTPQENDHLSKCSLLCKVNELVEMVQIRRIVLDVMKPFEPDMISYAENLGELETVDALNIVLLETDKEVQNIKITLEGRHLDYSSIEQKISELAGAIHSIDLIAAGAAIIDAQHTPQDKM